ncbi:type II toxin-antitoxin system RelE/ParE family toxin [Nostoc sp.]|uniref:type II toxin-antitoxin system RelE/ParE family toxin n=1 Tax=Nostoc sp. TaxID=1180 RepID=UPI002FF946A5
MSFPKNERSNINKKEEQALKMLASVLLSYTLQDLEKAKLEDELMEVICNAEEEISDS